MLKRKLFKALVYGTLLTLGTSLITGCGDDKKQNKPSDTKNKAVTIAMTSAWGSINPYNNTGNYSAIVYEQVYDRLWISKGDGTVIPNLAESYEVAKDHSYLLAKLNKKAKFSDGKPVTADDVVFSAHLATNPKFKTVRSTGFRYIAGTNSGGYALKDGSLGVSKVDDYTVKFQFKNPMNELPILTTLNQYFWIVPKHIYGNKSLEELNNAETWKKNFVGSGPFKYASTIDGERMEFVRNDAYFRGKPDIEKLTIRVTPGAQLLAGLKTGEVDILAGGGIGGLPIQDLQTAKEDKKLKVETVPNYGFQSMILNMASPKLKNAKIRQGINVAINRKAIVDNLIKGHGQVIYAPYPNNHPFVDESKLKLPLYNPQRAKQLLSEGGFDFNQTLELIVPTGHEIRLQSTVLIQQDLAAVGIKTKITQYDFTTLMQKMRKGQFDLGMIGAAGSVEPSAPTTWLNPKTRNNFCHVPDNRFMDLFNAASKEIDLEKEKLAYIPVWNKLLEETPIVYLYSIDNIFAYNQERLDNINPTLFEQVNWNISSWKLK